MGDQFAGNNTFIDRSKVDAALILQNRTDIVAVQDSGQNADIVQLQL